jgi:hypothetical protein
MGRQGDERASGEQRRYLTQAPSDVAGTSAFISHP